MHKEKYWTQMSNLASWESREENGRRTNFTNKKIGVLIEVGRRKIVLLEKSINNEAQAKNEIASMRFRD